MYFFLYSPLISNFFSLTSCHFSSLKPSNTGNIFLQLSRNIVALQVEKRCCTYYHPLQTLSRNKISLLQVEAACCIKLNWRLLFSTNVFNLQQHIYFVAWHCLRWVVIRATTLLNLQRNNVACKLKNNVARITGP